MPKKTEMTLALIKSHAVMTPMIHEIVMQRVLHEGFTIHRLSRMTMNRTMIDKLYYEHLERRYFGDLVASVTGVIVAMALSRDNAILHWRETLGATNPEKAKADTLRGAWGDQTVMANNVAHGSDSEQAARRELQIFFPEFIAEVWREEGSSFSPV